ncbi:hypothetical protein KJ713_01185 [Patescibacteria group bacterium]|nr:hypothetical protein [Patescibacteria group bacterium]
MKKTIIIFAVLIILAGLILAGYLIYKNYSQPKEAITSPTTSKIITLDASKVATHLSKVGGEKSAYWMRMFEIYWQMVEPQEGQVDFTQIDEMYQQFQENDVYLVVTIKPFVNWDQNKCHDSTYEADFMGPQKDQHAKIKVGKPCDMEKYKTILAKVVERYDGDGVDDMPGLTLPIKYWEIMNEPEMQGGSTGGVGEELKFYVGTPAEYLDILKASYETIKKIDSDAKVLHAGMAGMQPNFQDFWNPIFSADGGNYFDVANIHSINTDAKREDMYVIKFKKYLESFGIKNKPIFVTEAQFGELADKPADISGFDKLISRSTIFTLAQGGDVIFYIENWLQWDRFNQLKKENVGTPSPQVQGTEDEKDKPKDIFAYSEEDLNSSTHKVYVNLVKIVNQFDKIETLKEDFSENSTDRDGATTQVIQYKFIKKDKTIYVLWGEAALPAEISGQVKVTDIYGVSTTMSASQIKLTDSPIFVEKI